ncbi:MAG TPA: class I SAM-dependent methyltransferase, partial [Steroidobacteraceae bacterium]
VAQHYDNHLGPVYVWMVGDLELAFAKSALELDALPLPAKAAGTALDLGAGFGLHALPLAQRGYTVTAIDSCATLLAQLRTRGAAFTINTIHADIATFGAYVAQPVDAILCMGDTLTHLPDHAAVESLLTAAAAALAPQGLFAATFRDYSATPPVAERRFILVRAEQERILSCFLDYQDERVSVYDLLLQYQEGRWQQRVSCYPKLRLDPKWVEAKLAALGCTVRREPGAAGMVRIVAIRS